MLGLRDLCLARFKDELFYRRVFNISSGECSRVKEVSYEQLPMAEGNAKVRHLGLEIDLLLGTLSATRAISEEQRLHFGIRTGKIESSARRARSELVEIPLGY